MNTLEEKLEIKIKLLNYLYAQLPMELLSDNLSNRFNGVIWWDGKISFSLKNMIKQKLGVRVPFITMENIYIGVWDDMLPSNVMPLCKIDVTNKLKTAHGDSQLKFSYFFNMIRNEVNIDYGQHLEDILINLINVVPVMEVI